MQIFIIRYSPKVTYEGESDLDVCRLTKKQKSKSRETKPLIYANICKSLCVVNYLKSWLMNNKKLKSRDTAPLNDANTYKSIFATNTEKGLN
jgi:hypothetical protein